MNEDSDINKLNNYSTTDNIINKTNNNITDNNSDKIIKEDSLNELDIIYINKKYKKISAYGYCPRCNNNWDNGDIFKFLKKINPNLSDEELIKKSNYYGWTIENKKRFSKLKLVECSMTTYMCMYCLSFFSINELEF